MKNRQELPIVILACVLMTGPAFADETPPDSLPTTTPGETEQSVFSNETPPDSPLTATPDESNESAFVNGADEKWSKLVVSGNNMLAAQKSTPAVGMFKRALTQAQKTTGDETTVARMCAICNKKLGQAYMLKPDYLKADASLKDAKAAYDKLSLKDEDLDKSLAQLTKYYRTIEVNSLDDSVTNYLREAGVNKIAVFHQDDRDLVEVNLDKKYIKPIESKDVPKVSFAKKVSFQFFNNPNGDYQVSKIQGLQVLAKNLWVNLLESLLKAGTEPVAEVTAGKMGMTKTVSVNVPADMYDSTKKILDNLVSAIKGQPAYAAEPAESSSEETYSVTNSTQTDAHSSSEAQPTETSSSAQDQNGTDSAQPSNPQDNE